MIPEQITQRKRQTHKRRNAFHAMPDPEEQTRLDMLICARTLEERVYRGKVVDPAVIAQDGARARIKAAMEPSFLGKLIYDRVVYHEPVELEAVHETYPAAYAVYSVSIDYALKKRAWQAEQGERKRFEAFARLEESPCDRS